MEQMNLIENLKVMVLGSTLSEREEERWLNEFFVAAIDRVDFDLPESPASQAVAYFLFLARKAGIWTYEKTPFSVRRTLRKKRVAEASSLTVLCRLEGRIRDRLRNPRRNNASNGNDNGNDNGNASNGNASNGNASNASNGNGNGNDNDNGNDNGNGNASNASDESAIVRARLEGMVIMLRAIAYWLDDPERANMLPRSFIRKELQLAGAKIKEQLDAVV